MFRVSGFGFRVRVLDYEFNSKPLNPKLETHIYHGGSFFAALFMGSLMYFMRKGAVFDDLVKGLKRRISVIPAKAGIQLFQTLKNSLDSGFHRSDGFLRFHLPLRHEKTNEPANQLC